MARIHMVGTAVHHRRRLHLHAPQNAPTFDHEVVRGGIAVGLGDNETELSGAMGKAEFGNLALAFVVFSRWGGLGDGLAAE
jgi:hypothetical protein